MEIAVFWDVASYGSCKNRRFGRTSVLTRVTRRNIPEDGILHSNRCENLTSYEGPVVRVREKCLRLTVRASTELHIPQSTVRKVLRKGLQFKLYQLHLEQQLSGDTMRTHDRVI
jgi:hypothetical protein